MAGEGEAAPGRGGLREEGVAGVTDALETHFGVRIAVGGEILRIMTGDGRKRLGGKNTLCKTRGRTNGSDGDA